MGKDTGREGGIGEVVARMGWGRCRDQRAGSVLLLAGITVPYVTASD